MHLGSFGDKQKRSGKRSTRKLELENLAGEESPSFTFIEKRSSKKSRRKLMGEHPSLNGGTIYRIKSTRDGINVHFFFLWRPTWRVLLVGQ